MSPTKAAPKKSKAAKKNMVNEQKDGTVKEAAVYRSKPMIMHRRDPLIRALAARGIVIDTLTTCVSGTVHDGWCNAFKEELTDENATRWCNCHPTVAISRRPNPFDGLEPKDSYKSD